MDANDLPRDLITDDLVDGYLPPARRVDEPALLTCREMARVATAATAVLRIAKPTTRRSWPFRASAWLRARFSVVSPRTARR